MTDKPNLARLEWIGGNAACHHANVNDLADGLQSCTSCGAVRILAALSAALPARGTQVTPLDWVLSPGGVWGAQTAFGTRYSVADSQWTYGPTMVWFWVDNGDEAAKAAAQADYEARIMAALETAHHVNETPKSEHDGADVLTALPADVAGVVAEAGKVLEGVTLGPWAHDGEPWNLIVWDGNGNRVCFIAHSNGLDDARDVATARFIAWCREGVPALIALATAQAAQIAGLEKERDAAVTVQEMAATSGGFYARHAENATARAEAAETALAAERAKVARLVDAVRYLLTDVEDDLASAIIARAALSEAEARDE